MNSDKYGNIYTAGWFSGTCNFDVGTNTHVLTSNGFNDTFIKKLDASGNVLWVKSFGSINSEGLAHMTIDSVGNLYVTGAFLESIDFNPGVGVNYLHSAGAADVYVLKLDNNGVFLWAKNVGGVLIDVSNKIVVDNSNNCYITGRFQGTADFNPGTAVYNLASTGTNNIFILKLDINGDFVWAKKMGGSNSDEAFSLTIDNLGNLYAVGKYQGNADFDPSSSTAQLTSNGNNDIFIVKLDINGDFVWVRGFGGTAVDAATSIAVSSIGNVYVAGVFSLAVTFNSGGVAISLASAGLYDVFILKLNQISTSILNNKKENISLFPNPNNGIVNVKSDDIITTIEITNMLGANVYSSSVNTDKAKIDLTEIPAGVYFISIFDKEGKKAYSKFVKQ